MTQPFRSFVIFAEMRTGSNLLEATLNALKRVTCFGEAFNPYMMGWPDKDELKGITMAERDADPHRLLTAIFDNLMIAAGLFTYSEELISGVRIGLAPIEDFAYPLAIAFLLPAVNALLPRDTRADRH